MKLERTDPKLSFLVNLGTVVAPVVAPVDFRKAILAAVAAPAELAPEFDRLHSLETCIQIGPLWSCALLESRRETYCNAAAAAAAAVAFV